MAFGKGIGLMGYRGSKSMPKGWGMVENWGMSNNSWLFNMMGNSLDLFESWVGNCFGSNNGFLGQNRLMFNDGLRNMFSGNDFTRGNMGNSSWLMDYGNGISEISSQTMGFN